MSNRSSPGERNRDMQDMVERHVYGETEYVPGAGSVIKVRGTGTEDQEAPVVNTGFGMKLPKNSNAEVLLLGGGSDTNLKFALVSLPVDKQREWKEGRGGVQNPMDPTHAIEFQDGKAKITKGEFGIGESGTLEVKDGKVYLRGDVTITGKLIVNGGVVTPNVTAGKDDNVPDYDPS